MNSLDLPNACRPIVAARIRNIQEPVMIKYAMVSLFATLALSALADDRRAEESGEGQSAQDRRASS